MSYTFDFTDVFSNVDLLIRGARYTALLWLTSFAFGMAIGLPLGLGRGSSQKRYNLPATAYVEFFRNTPVLIQLLWFYYAFPALTGIKMPTFAAAAAALCLNTSAYCAEVFRAGIQASGRGQFEAGRALGMTNVTLMRRIILPQAITRMLPAFTNRAIELGKMTAVASIVAVPELMYEARLLSSNTFRPLEVFTVIGVIYFVAIYPITLFSYWLERRQRRSA